MWALSLKISLGLPGMPLEKPEVAIDPTTPQFIMKKGYLVYKGQMSILL